jgi:phosphatidylserine/phosphatidylglycerophosphate/cardiolipin synthase-like enzyme
VLVGSQNFSVASLGYNRELGILTNNPRIVAAIAATLAHDYARAASTSGASRVHIRRQVHGHRKRL